MVRKIVSFFCFCLPLVFANAQEQEKDFLVEDTSQKVSANVEVRNDSIDLQTIPYDWISYQMKVDFSKKGNKKSLQVFFVNRIDSIIYFNFNLFGIEIARAVATPDSFIFVNKLEENYYAGDYGWLSRKLRCPLSFNVLQSVMNARDFADFDTSFQKVDNGERIHLIAPQRRHLLSDFSIMQDITLNADYSISENKVSLLSPAQSLVIAYGGYHLETEVNIFSKLGIRIEQMDIIVLADLKNVKINVPGPTRIRIPEKFEKLN